MGKTKKKNKQIADFKPVPKPNSRKKYWLGAGIAGLVFAAAVGVASSCYSGKDSDARIAQPQNFITENAEETCAWKPNTEGILLTPEVVLKYADSNALRREYKNLEEEKAHKARTKAEVERDLEAFRRRTVPENYTKNIFTRVFAANMDLDALIEPSKASMYFISADTNSLFEELKSSLPSNEDALAKRVLNCAVLMAYKTLTPIRSGEDTLRDFVNHLESKIGDCSDYSYATANIYYRLCEQIGRTGLIKKIRIVQGFMADKNHELLGWHAWLSLNQNSEWIDIDLVNLDNIKKGTPVSMSTPVLYASVEVDGGYTVPVMSTQVEFENNKPQFKKYAHILPQNGKEK